MNYYGVGVKFGGTQEMLPLYLENDCWFMGFLALQDAVGSGITLQYPRAGAICAAPSILGHKGLLQGKTATCYTGFEKDLLGAEIGSDGVIQDGKYITARGAGVAVDFGLELVGAMLGKEAQAQIRASILCD